MIMINQALPVSFKGTTKIIALTDPHQETRKECALLTCALNEAKRNNNVLLLNGGDLFKGIYPRELEAQTYLDLKKHAADIEIAIALGNNDFGFDKDGYEFLAETCKNFGKNNINILCANVFDSKSGIRPDWIKPYTIIERDGDKLFVTGFCLDSINNKAVKVQDPKDTLKALKKDIEKEKPDAIIILNHDWGSKSVELKEYAQKLGIKTDLIIGGHEHYGEPQSYENIYYPAAFGASLFKFDLEINKKINRLKNIQAVENYNLPIDKIFEEKLIECEEKTGLTKPIAPSTLNLTKFYGKPCPLGSFLADEMKETAKTDGAFFSTGFLMGPMPYKKDKDITLYDFKKTIIADSAIKKVELNANELKAVFSNALENWHNTSIGNGRFLQASSNIKIVGKDKLFSSNYQIKQIYLNEEPLLDNTGNAVNPDKKFSFAIDPFIANGGQGFNTLKSLIKDDVFKDSEPAKINEILLNALKEAPLKYKKGSEYPHYQIIDL